MARQDPKARVVIRAGLLSISVGILILAAKAVAALVTDSTALLADASESIVNVIAAAMVTYSVAVAARPADDDHPYGHGKAEFVSAAVEGLLILIAASVIVVSAVSEIIEGPELKRLGLGMLIAGGAGIGNLWLGLHLLKIGKEHSSDAIRADGQHILTDVWTTVGSIIGLIAVQLTGIALIDPIIALLVAANILWTGYRLVREALGGLLDEEDFELLPKLAAIVDRARKPEWIDIHQMRTRRVGASRHVDLHFVVPRFFTIDDAHQIGDALESTLLDGLDAPGDVVVHIDPCMPTHCVGCAMVDCKVRSEPMQRQTVFDVDSLTKPGMV